MKKVHKLMKDMKVGETMEIVRNNKVIHITRVDVRGHFIVVKEDGTMSMPVYSHTIRHWLITNQI